MHDPASLSHFIKTKALALGFSFCGISKAEFLEDEAAHLEDWLTASHHAKMSYMERNFDKRLDPRLLVDGAKSVISLMINYAHPEEIIPRENYRIARFALGTDYHFVIKDKMEHLVREIETMTGPLQYRVFTDSAPVLERAWARRSGLGWIGKNANLIHPKQGSWFLLGEIISELELIPDTPNDLPNCGTCTRCIDLCPTQAIIAPQIIDANRCISYLTTELRDEIPGEFRDSTSPWIFGCDICQEVCPWNRFSKKPLDNWLNPNPELAGMSTRDWEELTQSAFQRLFGKSGINRIGFERFTGNIKFSNPQ
jgi:epoxyqueuosine reductase